MFCVQQGAKDARAEADAGAVAAAQEAAAVRQRRDEAADELARLARERQLFLEDWEAERRRMDSESAALLASMEVISMKALLCIASP